MGQFRFNHNTGAKKLEVVLEGTFDQKDDMAYITEYKRLVKSIDANNYEFHLDCTNFGVSAPNIAELLEERFKLYKDDNFKNITFILAENSVVLKMQFSRLAKKAGLTNYNIVM